MQDDIAPAAGGGHSLVLPPVLEMTAAAALKQQLQAALQSGEGLAVDAGQVQRISSLCLQVLVSAAQTSGPSFAITMASPAFSEAAALLGLTGALGLSEE